LGPADPPPTPSPTIARLVDFLIDDDADPLAGELARWLSGSARFRGFADDHRAKIRKKLRGATEPDARRDVRTELSVARLLLTDRRVQLDFEAYGSDRRGPDFTVTLGSQRFNVEVTRLRGDPVGAGFGALLSKLRQLPPSIPNAVIVAIEGEDASALDVEALSRTLRARADAKDEALFTARGFRGTRDFYERFLRLGAVIVWAEAAAGDSRTSARINPSARTAFPAKALRSVVESLRVEV
jgi:hypothetical protein